MSEHNGRALLPIRYRGGRILTTENEKLMAEVRCGVIQNFQLDAYAKRLGLRLEVNAVGQSYIALTIDDYHTNIYGITHGGVLMSMADTAMATAILLRNKKGVTITLSMDFMHSAPLTREIYAKPVILHDGQHTVTTECLITDANGKLFAKAHASFYILGPLIDPDRV